MTVEPEAPNPGNRSQTSAGPQAETQPPPQDDASPPSGNVPQSQAGTATSSGRQLSFDFRRLRPGDLIAGIASFVVLITLFFPWYSFAASAATASESATPAQQQLVLAVCADQPAVCTSNAPPQFSVSALGGVAGGWRYLILVVAIIAVLYVLSRALSGAPQVAAYHWQVLIGVTALQGLLVLIAFFVNPLGILDTLGSSSWAAGAFLGLIGAIAAVAGAVRVMQESKTQRAASPAVPDAAG